MSVLEPFDWIELTDFRMWAIYGLLDREQRTPQPIDVVLRLGLSLENCGQTDDLAYSINYADVLSQTKWMIEQGRWRLLESMAVAVLQLVLAPPAVGEERAFVQQAEIQLRKPQILAPHATPGVVLRRPLDWVKLATRQMAPGIKVEILQQNAHNGAYRITLDPHVQWQVPPQLALWRIAGEVAINGTKMVEGSERIFDEQRQLMVGEKPACLLAIAFPTWAL